MTTEQLPNGRFLAIVNGQPLKNKNGAKRTFKYRMEAERAAYIEAKKTEQDK